MGGPPSTPLGGQSVPAGLQAGLSGSQVNGTPWVPPGPPGCCPLAPRGLPDTLLPSGPFLQTQGLTSRGLRRLGGGQALGGDR